MYESQVVSVLMYNCGSWSAPKHIMSKLNTCQRKHLRTTLNICWPTGVISNKELYRRCQVVPITERVRKARWTLLGHILRMEDNSPAALALRFAVNSSDMYKGCRGRPRINLFNTLQGELKDRHNIELKFNNDLDELKLLASDRLVWCGEICLNMMSALDDVFFVECLPAGLISFSGCHLIYGYWEISVQCYIRRNVS